MRPYLTFAFVLTAFLWSGLYVQAQDTIPPCLSDTVVIPLSSDCQGNVWLKDVATESFIFNWDTSGLVLSIIDDEDPSNGNIADGAGLYTYEITCPADTCSWSPPCSGHLETHSSEAPVIECRSSPLDLVLEPNGNGGYGYILDPEELLTSATLECEEIAHFGINFTDRGGVSPGDLNILLDCDRIGYQEVTVVAKNHFGKSSRCQGIINVLDGTSYCDTIQSDIIKLHAISEVPDNAQIGDTVILRAAVEGPEDILTMQFSLKWDTSFFDYAGIDSLNSTVFTDLSASFIGEPGDTNTLLDRTPLSWFSPTFIGIDVSNGTPTTVFSIKLVIIECGISHQFISSLRTFGGVEFISNDYEILPYTTVNSQTNICSPNAPTTPCDTNTIELSLDHTCQAALWIKDIVLPQYWQIIDTSILSLSITDDQNPSNGNIVDGPGSFTYVVSCESDSCNVVGECWGSVEASSAQLHNITCNSSLTTVVLEPDQEEGGYSYLLTLDEITESLLTTCEEGTDIRLHFADNSFWTGGPSLTLDCNHRGYRRVAVTARNNSGTISRCESVIEVVGGTSYCESTQADVLHLHAIPEVPDGAQVGDTIRLQAAVQNANDLLSLQFAMKWDTTSFSYAGLDSLNSTVFNELNETLLNAPFVSPNSPLDRVTIIWFNPTFEGISLSASSEPTLVFSILLVVKDCSTSYQFITSPSGPPLIEILSEDFQELPYNLFNAQTNTCSPNTPVSLFMPETEGHLQAGDTLCVPILVSDYVDIGGFDFSLRFDTAALGFVSVQNLNTDLLGFSQEGSVGDPTETIFRDRINIQHYEFDLNERSLADGDTLFEACFTVLPDAPACTDLYFDGLSLDEPIFIDLWPELAELPFLHSGTSTQLVQMAQYELCEGGQMTINSTVYDAGHPSGIEYFDGAACDSMVNIQLVFHPSDTTYLQMTTDEQGIVWNDVLYDEPGAYEQLLTNAFGCDSLVMLDLSVLSQTTTSLSGSAQQSNAITPNGDGQNEVFVLEWLVKAPQRFLQNEFWVYNRHGQLVFHAVNYQNDWSGTDLRGQQLPVGTYYYRFAGDGQEQNGVVSILR